MTGIIEPAPLGGTLRQVIASKSQAHRLLICAALADRPTRLRNIPPSRDAEATCRCLRALGADMTHEADAVTVFPLGLGQAGSPLLDCGESGSTLRFLLPVAAALEADCAFTGQGKLSQRPLEPLYSELAAHGAVLSPEGAFPLRCRGKLRGGAYRLAGNVSSQFISGLLLALPLLEEDSEIHILGSLESAPYVDMTLCALESFGIVWEQLAPRATEESRVYRFSAGQRFRSPGNLSVEADWSGAAFFLAAGALSEKGITCLGLNPDSPQGDRRILSLLTAFGADVKTDGTSVSCRYAPLHGIDVDAADIPDLVPVLSAVAAYALGETRIRNIRRLRLKESDRVASVLAMIRGLGGAAESSDNEMIIHGLGSLPGGRVDAFRDHRIAMAAAVAASRADGPTEIQGIEAADKSYPDFFTRWQELGGNIACKEERDI